MAYTPVDNATDKTEAERLITRFDKLKGDRGSWESYWQEIAEYCAPNRANFTATRSPGDRRGNRLFDSTAQISLRTLANGLKSLFCNQSQKWFSLTSGDVELDELYEVKTWTEHTRDQILKVLADPAVGFYNYIHELFIDDAAFGTACMFLEDLGTNVRFWTFDPSQFVIAEGADGRVDTWIRRWKWTARQCVEKWGDDAGPEAKKRMAENKPDELVEIQHSIMPRDDAKEGRRDSKSKPWASVIIEVPSKTIVSESGYEEFPVMVPRWSVMAGETYGRSPGMDALPDMRMVNAIAKDILRAGQKAIDPSLMAVEDAGSPINLSPGALNIMSRDSMLAGGIRPIVTQADMTVAMEALRETRLSINKAFLNDAFSVGDPTPNMTATEVVTRRNAQLTALGSTNGRVEAEFLGPMIDRMLAILSRRGMLMQFPAALQGRTILTRYESILSRMQRSPEADAIGRLIQVVTEMMAFDPTAADRLDTDEVINQFAEIDGAPTSVLRSPEATKQLREQRAAQQQQQAATEQALMQAQALNQGAGAAKNLADAQATANPANAA